MCISPSFTVKIENYEINLVFKVTNTFRYLYTNDTF